jgi:uncharacterized protein (DUF1697 family)
MHAYVALLRAVNVGGTGKLPMSRLKSICDDAGFDRVETYIASGNVVFDSKAKSARVKAELEARLAAELGKPIGVVVRTASEMAAVLAANPFAGREPKHTYAFFLDVVPPRKALDDVKGRNDEEIALGKREIFIHYPSGMGRSKLRIPAASAGTARNMNTVAKLAEMAGRSNH